MQTTGGGATGPDPAVMAAIERGNAVVFLDVALGEGDNSSDLGRIKLELFVKDVSLLIFLIYSIILLCTVFTNNVSVFLICNSAMEDSQTSLVLMC